MSEQNNNDQELLTTEEVATILKVGPLTVRSYITQGKLAAFDLGGSYRVCRKDLNEFLRERYKPKKK